MNRRRTYQARQFAELAGVTVRTLHHYDRLNLLKPHRTEAGYRQYSECDLLRLEQIVALKFLGLPLKQIKTLLDRGQPELPDALRMQRRILEEKRRLVDRAITAISEAEEALSGGNYAHASLLKKIIEVIEMQTDTDWMMRYYSEEARTKIKARQKDWTPELQAQAEQQWSELFRDVEGALNEDPAGPEAQALAERWMKLVEGFTGGDPQVTEGLAKLNSDWKSWPADMQQKVAPFSNKAVWDFINRAIAIRKRGA